MKSSVLIDAENLKNPDSDISGKAFLNLVAKKSDAVPVLLELLKNNDQSGRGLAAEALASIADNSIADIIFNYLEDKNELVRSWSAVALRRMRDPRALDALLKTINDTPDFSHYDQTISTYALIQWGEEILMPVIELFASPDAQTRDHALTVVKKIVFNKVRTRDGWESIWKENGSYSPDLEPAQRRDCIEKWEKWINDNCSI